MKKAILLLLSLPKTIYFNFAYFPFLIAIKLPVWVSYRTYLREINGHITLKGKVIPGLVKIGFSDLGFFDFKNRCIWEVSGSIIFHGKANFGTGTRLCIRGQLELGDEIVITGESKIICYKKISLGSNCLLSWDIVIMDTDFHEVLNQENQCLNPIEEIIIGSNVWIGCRCIVLKGSSIANHSMIAANSLINKKFNEQHVIIGGSPGKIIKSNVSWKK